MGGGHRFDPCRAHHAVASSLNHQRFVISSHGWPLFLFAFLRIVSLESPAALLKVWSVHRKFSFLLADLPSISMGSWLNSELTGS